MKDNEKSKIQNLTIQLRRDDIKAYNDWIKNISYQYPYEITHFNSLPEAKTVNSLVFVVYSFIIQRLLSKNVWTLQKPNIYLKWQRLGVPWGLGRQQSTSTLSLWNQPVYSLGPPCPVLMKSAVLTCLHVEVTQLYIYLLLFILIFTWSLFIDSVLLFIFYLKQ